ncbi:DHA2 family efflux MFS transporter permease subunit [Asticcacaulis sp. EMRT-3]|uniref:DHA2 family efflux MFS transporter permease subunit n=1 Tax=Asticcacaulis sp. EMRT-3 TaxID=3040349 RepID=UPI0024AE906B|nr:DHA2 family efflux MFS transporter permease subunit [Asticcacaulis sp. EMRT-3]MDI7775445.1 DHA2 family efflux MFS transporter permease subunit [Asticcacaulis sp. EMRT-3]
MATASAAPNLDAIKPLLPWLVAVAFFMESLDTTILNTGVPVIAAALDVTALSMKSVLSSYTLALAVFIPISGWMADRFGTRRVFASAIGLFTLGSFLCGLATNIHWLVAFRVLQGMGGAMMVPVGRLILVRTFDHRDLVRAMSFVAIPMLVAPMVGPLLGGLIVDYLHWRVIFFVNIPVGLVGMALVAMKLPNFRDPKPRPLDFLGLILFSSGIALLSYVLEVFGEHRLGVGGILGLLGIAGLLLFGYGLHAAKTTFPLLLLGLFRIRTFATSVSGSFITRLGVGGVPFLLPLLYQLGLGMTPVQSGLLIMPQAIGSMSSKLVISRLLDRFGYATILRVNTLIVGALLVLFGFITAKTPIWLIVVLALIYGVATSIQYTSMNTLSYADVPRKQTSGASTIASTLQQLSVSFGVAVAGLVTLFFLPADTDNRLEMIGGLHKAFWLLGSFTLISTLIFSTLKKGDGEVAKATPTAAPSPSVPE